MLDVSLFRRPAFVGVQLATFCIGAGMFALFPFLSIYLQDILGYSPLGAGLRFLPITAFVFVVPLATRKLGARVPMWALLSTSLAIVAVGILLMEDISAGSQWTALLPGFIVSGIGIGLANPTIAGAALRVVDPARTGMASGISNTARITGLAIGVAVLGAVLEQRAASHLSAAGYHAQGSRGRSELVRSARGGGAAGAGAYAQTPRSSAASARVSGRLRDRARRLDRCRCARPQAGGGP